MLEVLAAGPLTTIQDLGRPGYAHLGVPRSGALDEPALRAGNRLVGNEPGAAGLEITVTGCRLRLRRPATVAVAGGIDVPPVLGSRSTDTLSGLGPQRLRDGDVLPLGVGAAHTLSTVEPSDTPSTVDLRIRP